MLRPLRLVVGAFLTLVFGATLSAHALHFTRLAVVVSPGDAELRIEANLTPFLGDDYADFLQSTPETLAARMPELAHEILTGVTPEFAPPAGEWRFVSWKLPAPPDPQNGNPDELGAVAFVWRATLPVLPADATLHVVSRSDTRVEFPVACSLSVAGDSGALTRWLESPGDTTRPLTIPAASTTSTEKPPSASPETSAPGPGDASRLDTFAQHLRLGFLHILPLGVDHILFVLGLYFLGAGWRPLAAQIGTFTIAHTTTLGLAAAGIVRVSPAIVEPLIALSIAFVALENIFRPRIGAGRLVTVFAFGLLHGLGFAGALAELELPRDQFFTALLAFNFGVDFGQLAVLALAFLAVGWFRQKTWYRPALAIPACALIAAIGLYWTVERAFF